MLMFTYTEAKGSGIHASRMGDVYVIPSKERHGSMVVDKEW
jgi:hypothetical protein